MMPAPNQFKTGIFDAPKDMGDECGSLEVLRRDGMLISCWEPSDEEINAIRAGDKIWLYVMASAQPPVAISVGARPIGM